MAPISDAVLVRPATFADTPAMGHIASMAYRNTAITIFLHPFIEQYPENYERVYVQRIRTRMMNPRTKSVVASFASSPETLIGYAQFIRLGEDAGARKQIASRKTLLLFFLAWFYAIICKVQNYLWPDRSVSKANAARFGELVMLEDSVHWKPFPERQCRWHAQSVVVDEKWQGRGIGKKLMAKVIECAQLEDVPVGLEASGPGEMLYRRLGFKLLARFQIAVGEEVGGVMLWTPEGWEERYKKKDITEKLTDQVAENMGVDIVPVKVD